MNTLPPLLSVQHLSLGFARDDAPPLAVVDGISFSVQPGETLAIVGESGCGKSVTAMSILRLTPARMLRGAIHFQGQDLGAMSEAQLRQVRGDQIGYIFQEPMTSLNPVLTIGEQLMEPLMLHKGMTRNEAKREAISLLGMVNIPSPEARIHEYPHQLSGGMRQRVMIAIAISCRPKLLIADEPTTALDVTVQAQILDLLRRLQQDLNMAIILITHDMGVVAEFSDRVTVMYAGRIAESAPTRRLFDHPVHPYTKALLASVPPIDTTVERLVALPGSVPSPDQMPQGCRFAPRCAQAQDVCAHRAPDLVDTSANAQAACVLVPTTPSTENAA